MRLQFHLAELDEPDVLNGMLPSLGRDWTETLMRSTQQIFTNLAAYAMEWEVVATRWSRDDYEMLQPSAPCWVLPATFCTTLMKGRIAKKELELCAAATCLPLCDHDHRVV